MNPYACLVKALRAFLRFAALNGQRTSLISPMTKKTRAATPAQAPSMARRSAGMPQSGAVTHHQLHVMMPMSFSVRKIRNIKPRQPIPPPLFCCTLCTTCTFWYELNFVIVLFCSLIAWYAQLESRYNLQGD